MTQEKTPAGGGGEVDVADQSATTLPFEAATTQDAPADDNFGGSALPPKNLTATAVAAKNFRETTVSPKNRPTYVLALKPEPHCPDPVRSLRRALKVLLRRFGLRAVSVEEKPQ